MYRKREDWPQHTERGKIDPNTQKEGRLTPTHRKREDWPQHTEWGRVVPSVQKDGGLTPTYRKREDWPKHTERGRVDPAYRKRENYSHDIERGRIDQEEGVRSVHPLSCPWIPYTGSEHVCISVVPSHTPMASYDVPNTASVLSRRSAWWIKTSWQIWVVDSLLNCPSVFCLFPSLR